MKSGFFLAAAFGTTAFLTGCAAPVPIRPPYEPPRTVVIEQIPPMRLGAFIGYAPLVPFTPSGDLFFAAAPNAPSVGDQAGRVQELAMQQIVTTPGMSAGTGAATGAVAGIMGAMMQSSAEETQRRAMNFNEVVLERFPKADFGGDFMSAVKAGLERQGISVTMAPASAPPRVRWPVPDEGKIKFDVQPGDLPPVDADLYVQISPRAEYRSPTAINAYNPAALAAIVVYNGRTKQFLHKQLVFVGKGFKAEHHTYNGLLGTLDSAIPVLKDALMETVPKVVDVISAREPKP